MASRTPFLATPEGWKIFLEVHRTGERSWRGTVLVHEGDTGRDRRLRCPDARTTEEGARQDANDLALMLVFPQLRKRFQPCAQPAPHDAPPH